MVPEPWKKPTIPALGLSVTSHPSGESPEGSSCSAASCCTCSYVHAAHASESYLPSSGLDSSPAAARKLPVRIPIRPLPPHTVVGAPRLAPPGQAQTGPLPDSSLPLFCP